MIFFHFFQLYTKEVLFFQIIILGIPLNQKQMNGNKQLKPYNKRIKNHSFLKLHKPKMYLSQMLKINKYKTKVINISCSIMHQSISSSLRTIPFKSQKSINLNKLHQHANGEQPAAGQLDSYQA